MAGKTGKGEDVTTRFGVDISDLKAGIQDANRQIRLANSEFKAASSGMDDWGNSADGLSAKIKQLTAVQEAETTKLNLLKQQYKQVAEEQGETSTAAQNLLIKVNNQQAAVNKVASELKSYEIRLNDLNAAAEESAQAAEVQKNAYETLGETISAQEAELKSLKTQYATVALEQGESSDAAKELGQQIEKLSSDLESSRSDMKSAEAAADSFDHTIDDLGDSAEDAKDGFSILDGAVSVFVGNLMSSALDSVKNFAGGIFDLVDATEEYRSMQAKIAGSAESFGYSIDFANEKYQEFYQYVADDQMATNAITNLMGMKVSTDTVSDSVDGAIAVWAAYGDSIPIESLTESMNESAQVAKVTGTLADVINWASRSNEEWSGILQGHSAAQKAFNDAVAEGLPVEDAYSAALAACADTQERADLIAQTLNTTYGESKRTYDELNGSILDANKAEQELKDTQADLAETVQPLQTKFTQLKNKALKEMSPAISDVTDEFSGLIDDIDWDGAAEMIGDMMETGAEGAKFLIENIEPITAILKGAATAWLTYKAAQLASNGITTITNSLLAITTGSTAAATAATAANTTATVANTAATKALSVAQMATPWGLIAGLVGGVVVGLVSYANATSDSTVKLTENQIATDELVDKYEEFNDQLEQNKQAREDSVTSAEAEIASADILVDKMETLAQKENKSNAEKEMMKTYVEQLNEILPDLNAQYDEEADKLNISTEAIRDNIEAQKDLVLAKAAQENMVKIAEDLAEAEIKLSEAEAQHETNSEELTNAKEKATAAYQEWIEAGRKMSGEEFGAWQKASRAQADAQEAYNESEKLVDEYTDTVKGLNDEYDKTAQFAQDRLDSSELRKALDALVEEAKTAGIEIPQAVSEGIENGSYALPESVEELESLIKYDSMVNDAKSAGIKIPESLSEGVKSGQIAPSAAVQQMNNLVNFNDLLEKSNAAGLEVPEYLAQQVAAGQMKPAEAVQQMEELVEYNDLLADAEAAGIEVPQSLKDGVLSGKTKPSVAIAQINNLMKKEADKSGPEMEKSGKNAGGKYGTGVSSKKSSAKTAAKSVALAASQGAGSVSLYGVGQDAGQGYVNGVLSKIGAGVSAGAQIVLATLNSARRTQQSNSPAKKWIKEGDNAGTGYTLGVEQNEKNAEKAGAGLVASAMSAAREYAQKNGFIDAIGLTDVKNNLYGSISQMRTSGGPFTGTLAAGGTTQQIKEITFNQYNNSPKALSRLDIYRQTKNQLFAAKGRL